MSDNGGVPYPGGLIPTNPATGMPVWVRPDGQIIGDAPRWPTR